MSDGHLALTAVDMSLSARGLVITAALIAAAFVLVFASARGQHRRGAERVLRAVAISLVVCTLLEPAWVTSRAKPGANLLHVLADDSRSLAVRDRGDTKTRGARLAEALTDPGWQRGLEGAFTVRRHAFGARLRPSDGHRDLRFDGRGSALGAALAELAARHRGTPVAGIVVFSDGNATDAAALDAAVASGALPPVYPVAVGGETGPDLAVVGASATRTPFEDAPAIVRAQLEATGLPGAPLVVSLVDAAGQVVETQRAAAPADGVALAVTFRFRPPADASPFYDVRASCETPPPGGEATAANNSHLVALERPPGSRRILYVAGRPNWEYKFLHRALDEDPELRLEALIRIGAKEPKFAWRGGRRDGDSNPLYRGFGAGEDAERYDESVFVRRGHAPGTLAGGFPRTAEELFAYDGLVIDDLDAAFFSAADHQLVGRFVTARGGGLAALAGQESLDRGGYARTAIGDLLPVYLDDGRKVRFSAPVKLELSREGWLEPWVRLANDEEKERARLAAMPGFRVFHRLPSPKPGAAVLAFAVEEGGARHPALVAQRAGDGRTVVVAVGDLWRWGLRAPAAQAELARFWRQTMRHLVAEAPRRVQLKTEPDASRPGATTLEVTIRDAAFAPASDATAKLTVTGGPGGPVEVPLEPGTTPGTLRGTFTSGRDGGFVARVRAHARDGSAAGEVELPFVVTTDADELRSLRVRRDRLEALARATGGRVATLAGLDELARDLPTRPAPITETHTRQVWHSPAAFLAVLLALAAEWASRRLRGAA